MRQFTAFSAALMLLMAWSAGLSAAPPSQSPRHPPAAQLQGWLADLDDEDYSRREEATERLHAAGEAAIDALARGALSGTPETAWRAGEALKRIAITGNERTIDRVAEALEQVGHQGRAGMHQVVAEIRARQKQLRHDRAAAQVRRMGGQLAGGHENLAAADFLPLEIPLAIDALELVPAELEVEVVKTEIATAVEEVVELVEPEAAKLRESVAETSADASSSGDPSLEAAGGIDVFRELERLPIAEEVAVEPAAGVVGEAVMVEGDFAVFGGILFGGGMIVEADVGGVPAESLMLDESWRGGDQGLEVIRDLPDIAHLSIRGAPLTDAALKHLAGLTRLTNISIQETKFSAEALRELHRARPSAYLFCQGEAMLGIHADTSGPCVLTSVYPGSGAAEAGLQTGDRIVAIDSLDIRDFSELTISVYGRRPGEKLKVELERDGKRQTATVELKPRRELEPVAR